MVRRHRQSWGKSGEPQALPAPPLGDDGVDAGRRGGRRLPDDARPARRPGRGQGRSVRHARGQGGDPQGARSRQAAPDPARRPTSATSSSGDLGDSTRSGHPVREDIGRRLPATIELALFSLAVRRRHRHSPRHLRRRSTAARGATPRSSRLAIFSAATPVFWFGLVLIYLFYARWQIAPPPVGQLDTNVDPPREITGLITVDALLTLNWAAFTNAARPPGPADDHARVRRDVAVHQDGPLGDARRARQRLRARRPQPRPEQSRDRPAGRAEERDGPAPDRRRHRARLSARRATCWWRRSSPGRGSASTPGTR